MKKTWFKYWGIVIILATIIIILSVLYLNFAVDLPVNPFAISDSNDKNTSLSNFDERCTFPGYYRVINENEKFLLSKEVNEPIPHGQEWSIRPKTYGNVAYFSDKSKAIADGHEDNQLVLLDFSSCKISKLPLGVNLNFVDSDSFFIERLLSFSSDNKFIVYEIGHRSITPPYPGSENYSAAETNANGVWIYNLQSGKNYQLRRLEIDSTTNNLSVSWATNTVSLFGADCPQDGCSFDLRKY